VGLPPSIRKEPRAESLGQHQLAADDYGKAIRLRLDDPAPWKGRGMAYSALGNYRDAIDDFTQATLLKPSDTSAYLERGSPTDSLASFAHAVEDCDRVLRVDPKNLRALTLREQPTPDWAITTKRCPISTRRSPMAPEDASLISGPVERIRGGGRA